MYWAAVGLREWPLCGFIAASTLIVLILGNQKQLFLLLRSEQTDPLMLQGITNTIASKKKLNEGEKKLSSSTWLLVLGIIVVIISTLIFRIWQICGRFILSMR